MKKAMLRLTMILTIFFLNACTGSIERARPFKVRPVLKPVRVILKDGLFCLKKKDAKNLKTNIKKLEEYIKYLEEER